MKKRRTKRDVLDFYPTPPEVTAVLRDWLAAQPNAPEPTASFLDPAAGEGHIVSSMRVKWPASFWHAIEIDPTRAGFAQAVAENVVVGDALREPWPDAHAVMNPPFRRLDDFWLESLAHRALRRKWAAVFTPVAWWNAEKRAHYPRPDFIIALGWRPVFRRQDGPAHKGSQDFAWSVLAPEPQPQTIWMRKEKPSP